MQKTGKAAAERTAEQDEELHDTLIAISVVAKMLARKMDEGQRVKEEDDV